MRWIQWIEPFGPNNEPVYCKVPEETAIAYQKSIAEKLRKPYSVDSDALDDFIAVHWAQIINE